MEYNESINESRTEYSGRSWNLWKGLMVLALCWVLSWCSPECQVKRWDRKVTRYEERAAYFWWVRKAQAEDYQYVALQENVQQDFKDAWAESVINEEIGYSHDWAEKQDRKILRITRKENKAQKRAASAREKLDWYKNKANVSWSSYSPSERLNPKEHRHIIKEESHN